MHRADVKESPFMSIEPVHDHDTNNLKWYGDRKYAIEMKKFKKNQMNKIYLFAFRYLKKYCI